MLVGLICYKSFRKWGSIKNGLVGSNGAPVELDFFMFVNETCRVFRARMKILVLMDISGNDSGYFDTKKKCTW